MKVLIIFIYLFIYLSDTDDKLSFCQQILAKKGPVLLLLSEKLISK